MDRLFKTGFDQTIIIFLFGVSLCFVGHADKMKDDSSLTSTLSSRSDSQDSCEALLFNPVILQKKSIIPGPNTPFDRLNEMVPELSYLLRDVDAFTSEMERRFVKQKKESPEFPYDFDYSEVGLPLAKNTNTFLNRKIRIVRKLIVSASNGKPDETFPWNTTDLETLLNHLQLLKREVRSYLKKGSMTYRETVEYSYICDRYFC